jgi:hypothetical protein
MDWVDEMFPGDGLELPTDAERDAANHLIAQWNRRWEALYGAPEAAHPAHLPVPRVHPDTSDEGFANYLAGTPTNRAYLRSRLRRWWRKP